MPQERLRVAAGQAARAASERLPTSWVLKVRSSYHTDDRRHLARRGQRALLQLVRLRGIPQDEPFPVPGRPELRMVPSDSYIANYLFWLGIDAYEPGEPDWWARLVATHTSVLELGANIGLYTVVGAAAAPVAYRAVEANPSSCAVVRRNLAVNGLDHVEVVEAAVVGERDVDRVSLNFPDVDRYSASGGAFVDRGADPGRPAPRSILGSTATRKITVPAVAIADLVEGIDLVKLDIEGLELDVLSAVRPWIASSAPTLVVEVLDAASDLHRFVADLVADLGYVCVAVVGNRPMRIPVSTLAQGRLQAQFGTRDVTLLSPARAAQALPTERTPVIA